MFYTVSFYRARRRRLSDQTFVQTDFLTGQDSQKIEYFRMDKCPTEDAHHGTLGLASRETPDGKGPFP